MSLSEQEQQRLREIEQSLLADDPKFGFSVEDDSSFGPAALGTFSLRGIAVGVIGLLMLVAGVALSQTSLWFIGLSAIGFLVMFGAGLWMLRSTPGGDGTSRSSRPSAVRVTASRATQRTRGQRSSGGISMEERFRRRFDGR